jgi:hypothetical protein
VSVHTPEDLILYKLQYYQLSQKPKHTRDIGTILVAQQGKLDMAYLSQWIERLGLGSTWRYIHTQAGLTGLDDQVR